MRAMLLASIPTALVTALVCAPLAERGAGPAARAGARLPSASSEPREGNVTTVRVFDDFSATIGFPSGAPGYILEENEVRNTISHLTYGRWSKRSLVVGIQGQSIGVIKDIGDVRVGNTEASVVPFLARGGETGFDTTLGRSDLPEAGVPLDGEARSLAAAEVHLGHVYLIRIDEPDERLFAAVRVIEHVPDQFVTVRWRML